MRLFQHFDCLRSRHEMSNASQDTENSKEAKKGETEDQRTQEQSDDETGMKYCKKTRLTHSKKEEKPKG